MVAWKDGEPEISHFQKQLIHGYNAREVALVESIWSGKFGTSVSRDPSHLNRDLTEPDVIIAAQLLLNGALNEDTLDDGWVCTVLTVIFFSFTKSGE